MSILVASVEPILDEHVPLFAGNDLQRMVADFRKTREISHLDSKFFLDVLAFEQVDKGASQTPCSVVVVGLEDSAICRDWNFWQIVDLANVFARLIFIHR